MFADKVEIIVQAGKGGDGRLSFRHEKFRAKGGPDGGNGGKGGSVVFEVDHNLNTLAAFRRQKLLKAGDGQIGGSDRKHGKAGEEVIVKVPVGTQVFEEDALVADLTANGQRQVVAKGGRGGFGNAHFTSSTRQAPRAVEVGEPGEKKVLTLELKLVADVGLVGLPNAGKSTLLSVITNAKPEIADYPFTTITPNLGVVDFDDESFLVADIPGLIEGASRGKGLGDEFLRHIERTAVVVHLIDAHSDDVVRDYKTIQNELKNYAVDLTGKPQIAVLTKVEGMAEDKLKKVTSDLEKVAKPALTISAVAGQGISELIRQVIPLIHAEREKQSRVVPESEIPVIDEASLPELWRVQKKGSKFQISGQRIEGFARRTNWNQPESVERLRDILRKQGVGRELRRQGAVAGSKVEVAGHNLDWNE